MSAQHTLVVLARGGYAARGVLYLIIGIFALLAAQDSTKPKDSHKSLEALLSQPFGYVLVGLVVAGLIAFAGWRILQAIRDVDHHGSKLKGLVIRFLHWACSSAASEALAIPQVARQRIYWPIFCPGITQTCWSTSWRWSHSA